MRDGRRKRRNGEWQGGMAGRRSKVEMVSRQAGRQARTRGLSTATTVVEITKWVKGRGLKCCDGDELIEGRCAG